MTIATIVPGVREVANDEEFLRAEAVNSGYTYAIEFAGAPC